MGIFDLFKKEGRKTRSINKAVSTVCNKKASDDERYIAYETLAAANNEEAVYGLLMRFTYVKDIGQRSRSTDEEDKRYVYDLLRGRCDCVLAPLREFLLAKEGPVGAPKHTISWGLRLLHQIAPDDETEWKILKEVLDDNEPGYERDPVRKLELLTFLSSAKNLDSKVVCEAIIPYLEDSDEGVRFDAAEALLKHGHASVRKPLATLLSDEDESLQQRSLILAGFIANGWFDEVEDNLSGMPAPALKAAVEEIEKHLPIRDFSAEKEEGKAYTPPKPETDEEKKEQEIYQNFRNLLIKVAEADDVDDLILSNVVEILVRSGVTAQGARGRLEKNLPKGYKVRKGRVERLPEGMQEPFLTNAAKRLMASDSYDEAAEPLVKILRNNHTQPDTKGLIAEFLAAKEWSLEEFQKQAKKYLPPGYCFNRSGLVERCYSEMREPYLTQAADNILDPYLSEPPDDPKEAESCITDDTREALLEIACNPSTDERTIERIMDRFSAFGWTVRDYEKKLQRVIPDHYRISAPRGSKDSKIFKVSTMI